MAWTEYNVSAKTNLILGVWFVASASLATWAVMIYRMTIIPEGLLWGVVLIAALAGSIVIYTKTRGQIGVLWIMCYGLVGVGFVAAFLILFINSRWAAPSVQAETLNIIEKGTLNRSSGQGCASPYLIVNFYGQPKQLVLSCTQRAALKKADDIQVLYRNGALGFPYIVEQMIVDRPSP